jgi:hypothetical protein
MIKNKKDTLLKYLEDGYYMCDECARAFKIIDGKRTELNLLRNRDEILSHNVELYRCGKKEDHRDIGHLCRDKVAKEDKKANFTYPNRRKKKKKEK